MKQILFFLSLFIALGTQAQKTKSTTISRIIAKDSIRLGGVWRSTWPSGGSGGSGTADSNKVWSIYGNSGLSNPLLGTKSNTGVNIIANNKLLLQVNTDSTVKVKSRIPDNDSTEQVTSSAWIKKNIEKILVFDSTIDTTYINEKTIGLHVNLNTVASQTYVDNSINNITLFEGWALTGNAGTDTSVNFIGNTDDRPLLIKSNNQTVAIFTKDTTYFKNSTSYFHSNIILDTITNIPGADADSKIIAFNGIGTGNTQLQATIRLDGGGGGGSLNITNTGGQLWLDGSNLLVPSNVSSLSNLGLFINSASGGFIMQNNYTQTSGLLLNVYGNGASRLAIDAISGNVGIGLTIPTEKLDVSGGIKCDSIIINGSVLKSNLPYKEYTAFISQSGTSAPVLTELFNNTGATFTTTYNSAGNYTLTASSAIFTSGKTYPKGFGDRNIRYILTDNGDPTSITGYFNYSVNSTTEVLVLSFGNSSVFSDDIFSENNQVITIKIYQ